MSPHRWNDIAMVFQGAMNAFNPVQTVGDQIERADGAARRRRGQGRPPAARSCSSSWASQGPRATGSARVLGRDEAARSDRDGARLRAEDPPRRRADDRARRDGAGADPRAARRRSHPISISRSSSSPTTSPSWPRSATAQRSCTRARSPSRPPSTLSSTPRSTRTRASSLPPRPTSAQAASASRRFPARRPRLDKPIVGCPFQPRCDSAFAPCATETPLLKKVGERHVAACHLNDHVREPATA